MAHVRPPLCALATVVAVAGCGGTTSSAVTKHSMTKVRSCLDDRGIEVRGGRTPDSSQDRNAPDVGELVMRGTFVAFYSSVAKAESRASQVRKAVADAGGTTKRQGDVTVAFFRGAYQDDVLDCLLR
jgi:hypothetical protein